MCDVYHGLAMANGGACSNRVLAIERALHIRLDWGAEKLICAEVSSLLSAACVSSFRRGFLH